MRKNDNTEKADRKKTEQGNNNTRRNFLKIAAASLSGLVLSEPALTTLTYVPEIDNPLDFYPDRDWEKIYRNQFQHDYTYHFLCAPNDTHNCLLRAYVKNGVITRIGPSYGYGKAEDLYGNRASSRWEPRLCQKGLALNRRIYGPRRVKYPMVRAGFKKWVEAEPGKAMPWKQDEVKKCFDTLNVLTRITTDQTAEYQSRALRGWDRFIQKFDGGKLTRELTIPLVQEVEVWARRMAAMDAGVLHFYRFVGVKQHG